jgi:hypothetical protein
MRACVARTHACTTRTQRYEAELLGIADELEDVPSMRGHLNVVQERRAQVAEYKQKAHDQSASGAGSHDSSTIKVTGPLTDGTITRLAPRPAVASAAT